MLPILQRCFPIISTKWISILILSICSSSSCFFFDASEMFNYSQCSFAILSSRFAILSSFSLRIGSRYFTLSCWTPPSSRLFLFRPSTPPFLFSPWFISPLPYANVFGRWRFDFPFLYSLDKPASPLFFIWKFVRGLAVFSSFSGYPESQVVEIKLADWKQWTA